MPSSTAQLLRTEFTDLLPLLDGPASWPPADTGTELRDGRPCLQLQARRAAALGSPFMAAVLEACAAELHRAPRLEARIAAWPGDPAAAALALRLAAGLHHLARRGSLPALSALYRQDRTDFGPVIAVALEAGEPTLLTWLDHPTQTNEVARTSAFMAGLMAFRGAGNQPVELIELGASAGLNLNLTRYAHRFPGGWFGDPASPVRITPEWRGAAPFTTPITLASADGVDLFPVDIACGETRERLIDYVWAGKRERFDRLSAAIELGLAHPPRVEQARADEWIGRRLSQPQADGTRRVVLHSMMMQYLSDAERRAIIAALMAAGSRATPDRPLGWLGFEWRADRSEVILRAVDWCGNGQAQVRELAVCHPYGDWIDWL